jgi:hypothetical protein
MATCSRKKLEKKDVETLLGRGYLVIPSKVRSRLMPTITKEYRSLAAEPDFERIFLMDDPRYIGEDGTPDVGFMPRDPAKKDMKSILHVTPQLIAEVNARGFNWECCPNLVAAVLQTQAEALMIACDVVRLLQEHCFADKKFYFGQTLEELFHAGQNGAVTRLLNYLPNSNKQERGTAAPHCDRNLLTVHFGSSHPGLYMMRDGDITHLDDMDPENVIVCRPCPWRHRRRFR